MLHFGAESCDCGEHGVERVSLFLRGAVGEEFFFVFFGVLVPEGLVDLLLALEVVLQQFDVVPVLLDRLVAAASHLLHATKVLNITNYPRTHHRKLIVFI